MTGARRSSSFAALAPLLLRSPGESTRPHAYLHRLLVWQESGAPPATQGVVVGPEVNLGAPLYRKPLHCSLSPSAAHALPKGWVSQQTNCRFRNCASVLGRHNVSGDAMFHHFPNSPNVSRDDRRPDGHDASTIATANVHYYHHPMQEFEPPTLAQLEEGVRWSLAEMAAGRTVLVHCRVGQSRSACMASAILIGQGHGLGSAIQTVKAVRRDMILSNEQISLLEELDFRSRSE